MKKCELKHVENFGFYEYTNGVWKKRPDNAIKGYIAEILGRYATGTKLDSILKLLKAETTTEEMFNKQDIFNFRNGVLDLRTGEFMEHSSSFMSSVQVHYNYDKKAKCPLWLKFINEVTAGDEGRKKVLQEMTGYVLFSNKFLQKCFVLLGDGANGKSVFLNIIRQVFGEENTTSVEMSGLADHFQRITLANSLLNISTETNTKMKDAESFFKQIVAGDPISGSFKHKDYVIFTPRCVLIFACNEYFNSRDTSDGFLRRICFIRFPVSFKGDKADKELPSKLQTELSGIFNWCYEGYKRLHQTKELTETTDQQEMMEEFIQLINPVTVFINEEMVGRTDICTHEEIYREYTQWCAGAGHKAMSRTNFIRTLKKTLKQVMPGAEFKKSGNNRYISFGEYPEWASLAEKNS